MNEDIRHQINITTANGSTSDAYMIAPYDCTVRDLIGTCQGDPGDAITITVTENSAGTTIGVLTFGSDITYGAGGTWVLNTSTGDHKIVKDEVLKFQSSASCDAAVDIHLNVELDLACR